jgi:Annexin
MDACVWLTEDDEKGVINILAVRNNEQRQKIKEAYKSLFSRVLELKQRAYSS